VNARTDKKQLQHLGNRKLDNGQNGRKFKGKGSRNVHSSIFRETDRIAQLVDSGGSLSSLNKGKELANETGDLTKKANETGERYWGPTRKQGLEW